MKTQVEKASCKTREHGRNREVDQTCLELAEEKDMSDFMDMKYEEALKKYLKNNPGKTEQDFIDEAIIRIQWSQG